MFIVLLLLCICILFKNQQNRSSFRLSKNSKFFPKKKDKSRKMYGILFDLDGTLVDSDPIHFEAWQKILAEINPNEPLIDRAFFDKYISGNHLFASSLFCHIVLCSFRSNECRYHTRINSTVIGRGT